MNLFLPRNCNVASAHVWALQKHFG